MMSLRSSKLRAVTTIMGLVMLTAGFLGGFLLTFWFLVVLLPLICVSASWMMAWTTQWRRELHSIGALVLTILFIAWSVYFLQNGAEKLAWYGIFVMSALLLAQTGIYLAANRRGSASAVRNGPG